MYRKSPLKYKLLLIIYNIFQVTNAYMPPRFPPAPKQLDEVRRIETSYIL